MLHDSIERGQPEVGDRASKAVADIDAVTLWYDSKTQAFERSGISDVAGCPPIRRDENDSLKTEIFPFLGEQLDPVKKKLTSHRPVSCPQDRRPERFGQKIADRCGNNLVEDTIMTAGVEQSQEHELINTLRPKLDVNPRVRVLPPGVRIRIGSGTLGKRGGRAEQQGIEVSRHGRPTGFSADPSSAPTRGAPRGPRRQRSRRRRRWLPTCPGSPQAGSSAMRIPR